MQQINTKYYKKEGVQNRTSYNFYFDTPFISFVILLALPASIYYLLCSTSMLFNNTACHITKFLY